MLQKWKSLPFECDCSSNLRQIIEQVFQITMDNLVQFRIKQIVWGKVADFPWWPGRIMKTDKHRNQTIYRVHFFGDPTYCYLKQSFLLGFQAGLLSLKEEFSGDLKLQKPIQLAKVAFQKQIRAHKIRQSLHTNFEEHPQNTTDIFEQSKTEIKPLIENIRKSQQNIQTPHQLIQEQPQPYTLPSIITTDNVIEILSSHSLKQLKSRRGPSNRKQLLTLKSSLKDKLLEKYNLHQIQEKQTRKPIHLYRRKIIEKNRSKLTKKRQIKNVNVLAVRKLSGVLEQYVSREQAREFSVKIGEKLEEVFGKQTSAYRKNFKNMILWLNNTKCCSLESFQALFGENPQSKKYEFDEKSKFTQISMEHENMLTA